MKLSRESLRNIIFKQIISESRYFGMSVEGVISFFEGFGNNTWIFFDTETTGFGPHEKQLTEIAAIAINPKNWESDYEVLGTFNEKIKLSDQTIDDIQREKEEDEAGTSERKGLSIPGVLSLTRYGEQGRDYLDESEVLDGFFRFIDSFPSPVLVAQNAAFDMEFISVRSGGQMKRYPVIDTMKIMQLFLIPLLRTLREPPHNDEEASEFLSKIKRRGRYTSSMGVVSSAYGISIDEWHNALADVKMLMELFVHVIASLKSGIDIDISDEQSKVAAHHIKMKKRKKRR
jgi:DNA polymerase III epsilon subunit-like protein